MNGAKKDQVFISYAHEDLETVKNVVLGLKKRKLNIWFDKEDLLPGKWKPKINREIARSRYFLICISAAALRKTGKEPGFQDEELQTAYDIAQAQPDKEFSIVPVRLEDCGRGDLRITSFQQYDLFPDMEEGLDKLAVHLGGVSLSDNMVQDERTDDEKFIESLLGKAASALYAKDLDKALKIYDLVLDLDSDNIEASNNKKILHDKLEYVEKDHEIVSKDVVDGIEAEPPSFIKNIKWFFLYWKKSPKYILIATLLLGLYATYIYRDDFITFFFKTPSEKQTSLNPEHKEKSHTTDSRRAIPPAKGHESDTSENKE